MSITAFILKDLHFLLANEILVADTINNSGTIELKFTGTGVFSATNVRDFEEFIDVLQHGTVNIPQSLQGALADFELDYSDKFTAESSYPMFKDYYEILKYLCSISDKIDVDLTGVSFSVKNKELYDYLTKYFGLLAAFESYNQKCDSNYNILYTDIYQDIVRYFNQRGF